MVENGAFSHTIDYITIFLFEISKKIKIALPVQELRRFCWRAGFILLNKAVELVDGGSVKNRAYPV